MNSKSLFTLHQVTIGFPGQPIMQGVDWEISKGEHWIVSGLNGVGKTTLVKTLAGQLRPILGSIGRNIDDPYSGIKLVSFTDTSKLFKSVNHVHYYQQRFNSWDADGHLTVAEYLATAGYSDQNSFHKELVLQFDLRELLDRERIKLSSGQTRKMLITRAILSKPEVLILDNPYIGLDAPSRAYLNDLLDQLVADLGMTLILSGQFTVLPKCISHRLNMSEESVIPELLHESIVQNTKAAQPSAVLERIEDVWKDKQGAAKSAEVFRFEDVDISYGEKQLVKNINWNILRGDKWNLIGNNGSGKSTLISLMYGDNPQVYARKVFVFGNRRGRGESIWDIKQKIGFTSAEIHAYIDSNLSAIDVVLTGLFDKFELLNKPENRDIEFAKSLLNYFNLLGCAEQEFAQLSTGNQRVVLLLRALIKAPPVLILDEPFQGFDELNIALARELIDTLMTDRDTLIFISHFQTEVPKCVDQVMAL